MTPEPPNRSSSGGSDDPRAPSDPQEPGSESPQGFPPGLRIALYFLIVVVLVFDTGALLLFVWLHGMPEAPPPGSPPASIPVGWLLAVRALMAPTVIVATIGFVHFIDKKPVRSIGAGPPRSPSLWAASLLSVAALGLWLGGVSVLGEWSWTYASPTSTELMKLAGLAFGFLAAACVDEWVFRGYIFSALRERFRWTHAAGLTAILFALRHASNPQVETAALFNMFLLGLTMAAIREWTGSLWPVVLFHGLWNFLIGCVFSLPLSGLTLPGLAVAELRGREIWTGGDYGPEASWLLAGALLVLILSLGPELQQMEEAERPDEDSDTGPDLF